MKTKLLYFLCLYPILLLFAQEPITIPFTAKEGLPDVEFYDLLEDHQGFIWLAADKGLFRYNGKKFENYTIPVKRGLSVFGLQEDSKGTVWCNNISGQFFYADAKGLHLFIDLKDDLKGQLPEYIIQNNTLYVFFEKGIFEINLKTKIKKRIQVDDTYSYYGAPFTYQNEVYFTVANHIKKIIGNKTKEVFNFHNQPLVLKNSTFWNTKTTFFFSSWYEEQQHFFVHASTNKTSQPIAVPSELQKATIIRTFAQEETIWFCTNKGLFVCHWNGNELQLQNHYLKDNVTTKVIRDQNNNYWISTLGNGILVLPNIGLKKINLGTQVDPIKSIITIENQLIYGNSKGIIGILNPITKTSSTFHLPNSSEITQMIYDPVRKCVFISQKDQSYFWDITHATLQPTNLFTASKHLYYDTNGLLLNAGFDRGNMILNPFDGLKSVRQEIVIKTPKRIEKTAIINSIPLRLKRAYTCFSDAKKQLKYYGFVDELICYDVQNKGALIRDKNQPILSHDMAQTQNGVLWIATFSNGIYGLKNGVIVTHLEQKNGLLSNQIRKLKEDQNTLWILSDSGIQAYDTHQKSFKNITTVDGFVNYNITAIALLHSQLYLAANDGIYTIDKTNCFKKWNRPQIYFTEFAIQEKSVPLQNAYSLAYHRNDLKIAFNVNGYRSNENIQYQYRLKGHNNQWLVLDKGIDFVRYSSLPPGTFSFEVKAKNSGGIFSKVIAVSIVINHPYWQTWWFYLLLAGLISMGIWYFFKRRFIRMEKEKQIEIEKMQLDKELIHSQLENLRSQMNPHFIFNALNSIQEYIITNEKVNASAFLVKFSRLIRMYLEHSRENEVPLEEEIKALTLYLELEKDRFEEALEYDIIVAPDLKDKAIKIPSLFIQPYVENALKHGLLHKKTDRKLRIQFQFDEEKSSVLCIVEDNGIGRKQAENLKKQREHLHRSFATSANQKRVELINKIRTKKAAVTLEDLYDENGIAKGTLVKIIIPV